MPTTDPELVYRTIAEVTGAPLKTIGPETDLVRLADGDDALELLEALSERYGTDFSAFPFSEHFNCEGYTWSQRLTGAILAVVLGVLAAAFSLASRLPVWVMLPTAVALFLAMDRLLGRRRKPLYVREVLAAVERGTWSAR